MKFYTISRTGFERKDLVTQLIQFIEDPSMSKISKLIWSCLILIKPFDKVNHLKLLFKVSQHGVKGKTVDWIKRCLVGRTQAVVLEGQRSSVLPVTSGVP